MRALIVTFDYTGITRPSDDAELIGHDAYAQWQREFLSGVSLLDNLPLLGYSFGNPAHQRVSVRFIVGDEVTNEVLVRAVQEMYDVSGLSGDFKIGTILPYKVKYLMPCTEEVWAYSDEEAKTLAQRLVDRCEATLVSVTEVSLGRVG